MQTEPRMIPVPPHMFSGGKPIPREWLRGEANVGQAAKAKGKRRAAGKRAKQARKANR